VIVIRNSLLDLAFSHCEVLHIFYWDVCMMTRHGHGVSSRATNAIELRVLWAESFKARGERGGYLYSMLI
jgi:hypothetical protein